jgi:hypothetical protein
MNMIYSAKVACSITLGEAYRCGKNYVAGPLRRALSAHLPSLPVIGGKDIRVGKYVADNMSQGKDDYRPPGSGTWLYAPRRE